MSNFKRTFGPLNSPVPLSYLDDNFQQLETASTSTVSLTGAALIGFAPSGTGAPSTTVATALNNMVWNAKTNGGCVGDGTTNDYTALNNVVTSASAAGGGIVYLPQGTYLIGTNTLTLPANVRLVGAGKTVSIIKSTNAASGNVITVTGDRAGVADLGILGAAGGGDGISVSANVGYFSAERVRIVSTQRGVVLNNGNYLISLRNVEAVTCRSYGFYLISAATVHNDIFFNGCFANTCSDTGYFLNNSNSIAMVNCAADTNTNYGFNMNAVHVTLEGCTAEANTVRGFTVTSTGDVTFKGCVTSSQLLPFSIFGAANVTLINPYTNTTPSGNALELNASATGQNVLIGADLDAGTFITSGGKLTTLDSTGIKFENGYVQRVLAKSAVAAVTPSDVTEDTLATITVPAGAMGANGKLRVSLLVTATNNANTKTIRVRFSGASGTVMGAWSNANWSTLGGIVEITNRNATNSQLGGVVSAAGVGAGTLTGTASVDTTAATTIVITGQKANSADTLTLESYCVDLCYGA